MKHLKPEQRPVMLLVIHHPTGVVRQTRDSQQCMRQCIELLFGQLGRLVLWRQPHLPQNFDPQIVA
ncbi:hypothetical protein D3C76_1530110 [compost metagenome]